jgi:hypothetical protein
MTSDVKGTVDGGKGTLDGSVVYKNPRAKAGALEQLHLAFPLGVS